MFSSSLVHLSPAFLETSLNCNLFTSLPKMEPFGPPLLFFLPCLLPQITPVECVHTAHHILLPSRCSATYVCLKCYFLKPCVWSHQHSLQYLTSDVSSAVCENERLETVAVIYFLKRHSEHTGSCKVASLLPQFSSCFHSSISHYRPPFDAMSVSYWVTNFNKHIIFQQL